MAHKLTETPGGAAEFRPLSSGDAPSVLGMIAQNSERFRKGGLAQLPFDAKSFQEWISDPDEALVGIWHENNCVGFCGVTRMRRGGMAEAGAGIWYGLDHASEGKGLASQAILFALRLFKERFPVVTQAVIHCRSNNRRSLRMATRLGFTRAPEADYQRYESCRSVVTLLGHESSIETVLNKTILPRVKAKASSPSLGM